MTPTDPAVAHDERRDATRFPCNADEEFAAIWLGAEEPTLAEVFDESLGGISLLLDRADGFGLGCTANIAYRGGYYVAQARHVKTWHDGRLLIGFICEPMPGQAPSQG
ncbi:MAG: hypothetical protein KDA41_07900 [Planctomycetales bacterium]|nr:hypothetical protein [Planctomycetales bacterium]